MGFPDSSVGNECFLNIQFYFVKVLEIIRMLIQHHKETYFRGVEFYIDVIIINSIYFFSFTKIIFLKSCIILI